jgi:hypothetical protein
MPVLVLAQLAKMPVPVWALPKCLYWYWHCWKKEASTGIGIKKIPIPVLA